MTKVYNKFLFQSVISIFLIFHVSCDSDDASSGCNLSNEACSAYELTNLYRQQNGFISLSLSEKCNTMAQDHADDMQVRNFFDHDSPTESFAERLVRYGLDGYSGENIGRGDNANEMLQIWMGSDAHRSNILNTQYSYMGIGYNSEAKLWVQCFSSKK